MSTKFTWTGQVEVLQKLRAAARNAPKEFRQALRQEGGIEVTEVKRRTPVEFGLLRASIHLEEESSGRTLKVAVVAGGPAAPYAWYVHENLTALHTVGEAKFVERPLMESAPYMAQRVARRIDLNRLLK